MALPSRAVFDLNPRTTSLMRVRGVVTPNEAANVLAVLYPALLRFAGNQLRTRHLDEQLAEDLVQEAVASWFAAGGRLDTTAEMNSYLRRAITNRGIDMRRRQADVLDHQPLPLGVLFPEEDD